MEKQITLCARSPLGRWIALLVVALVLLLVGIHLATDGQYFMKSATLAGLPRFQRAGQTIFSTLSDHFKKYDRLDLLVGYGVSILVGFALSGVIGGLIRSYRFSVVRAKAGAVIERRSLWAFIPLTAIRRFWRRVWTIIPVSSMRNLPIPLFDLYIPGLARRVPVSRIKRLEIQSDGEGATALVAVFRDESAWTLSRGRTKRLQRLGSVLSRAMGMERRDLLTWS